MVDYLLFVLGLSAVILLVIAVACYAASMVVDLMSLHDKQRKAAKRYNPNFHSERKVR